jgi:hypothetical protein
MDETTAAALREPFPVEKIGKLPRVTCTDCSDRKRDCQKHVNSRCKDCKAWVSPSHIHLDFVGHADTTDRFLQVDPDWSWEPVERQVDQQVLAAAVATGNTEIVKAVLDSAPPKFDDKGGLWIRLTIAGVTRLGYGDAQGKSGPNAVKEVIGDALRNAGMRFGVGLDMWRKESAEAPESTQVPERQRTDKRWLESIGKRIEAAESVEELRTLRSEIDAKVHVGRCQQGHYEQLVNLGRRRLAELSAAAPPPADEPQEGPAPEVPESPAQDADVPSPEAVEARIQAAETTEELERIKAAVMADFKAQKYNPRTGGKLLRMITTRRGAMEADEA